MSLKTFHVFFIAVSVLLCLGFGAWCVGSDYGHGKTSYAVLGCASFALGAALVIYEVLFLRNLGKNH